MAKGRKIAPGRTESSLTLPQVRMILRIYWTDQYVRRKQGLRTTPGLRVRLAEQFGTSVEVIKKVISIKENQHRRHRRSRFKTIALKSIKRNVQRRLRQRDIEVPKGAPGRPRKRRAV